MPPKRRKLRTSKRKPFTPTIMLFALLVVGVIVIAYGLTGSTTIEFYGVSVSTTSLGFAILALDVALLLGLTLLGIRAGKKGTPEYPYYDPPRIGENVPKTIICPDCRRNYSNSLTVCPNCGHQRPLH